jgi:hypothetical protein
MTIIAVAGEVSPLEFRERIRVTLVAKIASHASDGVVRLRWVIGNEVVLIDEL